MTRRFDVRVLATSVLASAVAAAACAPAPQIAEVTLGAHDYAFTMPDSVAGGLVRVRFVNHGQELHHAQFVRLNEGVTRQQFDTTFQAVLEAAKTEGEYQMICFVPSPDGAPHVVKGMIKPLTVTGPPAPQPSPPAAAGTVDMADFAFATMPQITPGGTTVEVINTGDEPHEMGVLRLKGISAEQLLEMLAASPPPPDAPPPPGPPPFEFVGGLQVIMPDERAWVTLDLPPGEYALVCFFPSPANEGKPHTQLGMFRAFTVE